MKSTGSVAGAALALFWWVALGVAMPAILETTTLTYDSTTITMTDPADRTYPTTITSTAVASYVSASTTTIDHLTFVDPWPVSPIPESFPYTMKQTRVTVRTVLPPSRTADALPATTITAYATYILWTLSDFDMVPYIPPGCADPGNCKPPAIKPTRCESTNRETRCATQCEVKDFLWFCLQANNSTLGASEAKPQGRACYGKNGEWEQLLEPCDHTDFAPWCKACEPGWPDSQLTSR
ncbi:hypothetical protein GQ53DRAFT_817035 [Thozetella sp. PMI_491]|nr:hypothetical protein GQ53DRAFT_817035 [Thozetella sp. PMI_491]